MQDLQLPFLREGEYVASMTYIDKRQELKILGKEPFGYLVELPSGQYAFLDIQRVKTYTETNNNTLLPKK